MTFYSQFWKEMGECNVRSQYPAEAFALAIILFSSRMTDAFAAGVLLLLSVVLADCLKHFLEPFIPAWSLRLCVCVASGSFCASVFLIGFAALGTLLDTSVWIGTFAAGLLCARFVLRDGTGTSYGELFGAAAIIWGIWILCAAVREYFTAGSVAGYVLFQTPFQSSTLSEPAFSFLTAGLTLALTNRLMGKDCREQNSLYAAIPVFLLLHPFTVRIFGEAAGFLITAAVPALLFLSVRRTLRFSCTRSSFRGLPADLTAAGFIYMILSIY